MTVVMTRPDPSVATPARINTPTTDRHAYLLSKYSTRRFDFLKTAEIILELIGIAQIKEYWIINYVRFLKNFFRWML